MMIFGLKIKLSQIILGMFRGTQGICTGPETTSYAPCDPYGCPFLVLTIPGMLWEVLIFGQKFIIFRDFSAVWQSDSWSTLSRR